MIALAAAALLAAPAAQPVASAQPVTAVLVHGALVDASSWNKVSSRLQAKGIHVLAVQLPETSLQEDVAATRRALSTVKGPIVLVGHSYGGVVIGEAAGGAPGIRSLVYVAALAPDQGESAGDLQGRYPPSPGAAHIQPQTGDYLWLDPAAFRESFCQDVPAAEAALMAHAQKPINKSAFAEKATAAAWHGLPSWYVLTTDDRLVSPDLQRFMAKRMQATVVQVASSHAPMISHPDVVVRAILAAARAPKKP
ncbi:MAG: alpha/beta hydrolase [Myxococcales bacterium]